MFNLRKSYSLSKCSSYQLVIKVIDFRKPGSGVEPGIFNLRKSYSLAKCGFYCWFPMKCLSIRYGCRVEPSTGQATQPGLQKNLLRNSLVKQRLLD
jgi:hypothetical protein